MSSKVPIVLVVVFSLGMLFASYFLVAGGQRVQRVKIAFYAAADKEKPKIGLKNNFFDLGQMKVSQQKAAEFIIKNTGQKTLQLFDISTSCGCTVASLVINGQESKEFGMHTQSDYVGEVAPGKTAKVKVIYRPYVMPVYGLVEREAYLSTNDPEKPKLILRIRAFVK